MRNGTDRRSETRGQDRRDTLSVYFLAGRIETNARRILDLLTFAPDTLATDADARRAEAARIADDNSTMVAFLSLAK